MTVDKRELAANIKQILTMRQVVTAYGFEVNRAGYIHCPFHAGDNQGSLKVYDGQGGFCCFGCGEKGSVIDFVIKLNGISFSAACERLDTDFSLGLPLGRQLTRREKEARKSSILAAREQDREQVKKQSDIDQKYWDAFDLWCIADMVAREFRPDKTDGKILSGYINAVRDLPLLADNLTQAEIERWKFEHTSSNSGMGKGKLPDTRTV